jgi:hypothetical protein
MINVDNIGKMMLAAEHYKADGLQASYSRYPRVT